MTTVTGDLPLIGRNKELAALLDLLKEPQHGKGGLILLTGPAGVGKTRLAREVLARAGADKWRILQGKCMNGISAPFLPVREALRDGHLEHLMDFMSPPKVEHAFLISSSGRTFAMAHRTKSGLDSDIFAGMVTAVMTFVKETIHHMTSGLAEGAVLSRMDYGNYHILVEGRSYGILAVIFTNQETELLKDDMADTMDRIGAKYTDILTNWDGCEENLPPVQKDIELFISSGKYDGVDEVTEPENRHWRLLTNLTRGLERALKEAPMLMFIDDLQWIDQSSLGILRHLLERLKERPFVVLGTYRPEDVTGAHPLMVMRRELEPMGMVEEVTLTGMDERSVRSIVALELGEELGNSELGELITRNSGGMAFLARELVTLLKIEGVVKREEGRWHLCIPIEAVGIPKKASEAVLAMVGQLSKEEREVLETSAVIGEVFRPEIVSGVLDMSAFHVHRALREMEQRHRLVRAKDGGKEYQFTNPLVREVVYDHIPKALTKEYHKAITDCLVKEKGTGMAQLAQIAENALAGEHPDAIKHLCAAGESARKEFLNAQAVQYYGSALRLSKDDEREAILEALGDTEFFAGRSEEAAAWFEAAVFAANEKARRVHLVTRRARALERLGKYAEGFSAMEAEAPDGSTLALTKARWYSTRAFLLFRLMRYDEARSQAQEALDLLNTSGGDANDIADAYNTVGVSIASYGKISEGAKYLEKGLTVAEAGGALPQAARIRINLVNFELEVGGFSTAYELAHQALRDSERMGNRFFVGACYHTIGYCQRQMGDLTSAIVSLTTSMDILRPLDMYVWLAGTLQERARIYIDLGMLDEAEKDALEGLKLTRGTILEWDGKAVLGEVFLAQGRLDEAEKMIKAALALIEKGTGRIYICICRRNLARIYQKQGRRAESEKEYERGMDIESGALQKVHRVLGLRWWGEALMEWGEPSLARKKLEEAADTARKIGMLNELKLIEKDLKEEIDPRAK